MGSTVPALTLDNPSTPSSARQVQGSMSAAQENIACVDTQIRNLTHLRDQELKPLLAPIRRLPVELLAEIFLLAVDSTEDWLAPALVVSQVCAHWRRVACGTPQLWNRDIALDLTKPTSDDYLVTTKTFFERSAPLPIPISLANELPEAAPLAEFICSLAPRWESLTWSGCTFSRLRGLPSGALNSLESVDLRGCADVPPASPIDVFRSAPRLCVVTLDPHTMGRFHMPWSQLTSLTLTEREEEEEEPPKPAQLFLDILLQCPNIEIVHFGGLAPWTEAPASSAPVTQLTRLRDLTLLFEGSPSGGQDTTPFFSQLALPALTSLCVFSDSEAWWSIADFSRFQRRSPNVDNLHLMGITLTVDGFVALLGDYPHLLDLRLDDCFGNSSAVLASALEFLAYKDTASPAVARLRRLSITDPQVNFVDEAIWQRMILSRWWNDSQRITHCGVRLDALTICDNNDYEVQFGAPFMAKMKQIRAEGLQLFFPPYSVI